MPRFYIDPPAGDLITLTGEDARHICRSLRMSAGETLVLCDGACNDYNGVLRQADGQTATVEILPASIPNGAVGFYPAVPSAAQRG